MYEELSPDDVVEGNKNNNNKKECKWKHFRSLLEKFFDPQYAVLRKYLQYFLKHSALYVCMVVRMEILVLEYSV